MTIRRAALGLAALTLVAGCGTTAPASGAPGTDGPAVGAASEAYVVTIDNDDRPYFDLRVDAVAPTGGSRPIATFTDVHPAGWTEASPYWDMRAVIGPTKLMPVVVERNGGMDETDVRTLLLDLRPGGGQPVEVVGSVDRPFWGPNGQLATLDSRPETIDLRTGISTPLATPERVEISPAWLADGSGWAATRSDDDDFTPGVLSTTGTFTPGRAPLFESTGLERFVGANGGTVGLAVSDGATESEAAIVERRPDLPTTCTCQVWARNVQPGDDPVFGDAVWDASGTGLWLVFTKDDRHWLSHLVEPEKETRVSDLPPAAAWRIDGISADDRWIVLASEDAGALVLVDTAAGAARPIGRVQGNNPAPIFSGWVR